MKVEPDGLCLFLRLTYFTEHSVPMSAMPYGVQDQVFFPHPLREKLCLFPCGDITERAVVPTGVYTLQGSAVSGHQPTRRIADSHPYLTFNEQPCSSRGAGPFHTPSPFPDAC